MSNSNIIKAKLWFYKDKGTFLDRAIRFRTNSKYSHVELELDGLSYSASPLDGGVRIKRINFDESRWDCLECLVDEVHVKDLYNNTKDNGYDFIGVVFAQGLNIGWESKDKYFCSEWVAEALELSEPYTFSPGDLFKCFSIEINN